MYAIATGQQSRRGMVRLAAAATILLLLTSISMFAIPVRANDIEPAGAGVCIDESTLSDEALRDRLRAAGSHVADPQDASGSLATSWSATIVVPDDLCQATVSFSSYVLPLGEYQPYEAQELFDNVTATYLPGTYQVTVDVGHPCGWQVDLYVGSVLWPLIPNIGHPPTRQIDVSGNATGEPCEEEEVGGTIEIRKETNPDGSSDQFEFDASFSSEAGFVLADGQHMIAMDVLGAHTVTETISDAQNADGWSLTSITCTGDADTTTEGATAHLMVDPDETIVCTFLNSREAGGEEPGNPPPNEGTKGGSGGPTPELPDTATEAGSHTPLLILVIAAGLVLIAGVNLRAARQRA